MEEKSSFSIPNPEKVLLSELLSAVDKLGLVPFGIVDIRLYFCITKIKADSGIIGGKGRDSNL